MNNDKRSIIFEKRSSLFDRNMKIIKKKSIEEVAVSPRGSERPYTDFKSEKQISEEAERHIGQMEPLKAVVRKVHVEQKVKQFISKLKRNNFTNQMKLVVDQSDERVQKFVQKVEEIDEETEKKATQGIVLKQVLDLTISLLSFFTVIYMQVISSFESFLIQFQIQEMGQPWLLVSQYVSLLFATVKMVRNFTTVKTVNGYRLIRIEKIFFSYLYSMEFIMDILFACSLVLMITRPYSVFPAYMTYVISLIVILISPRLDEIIVSHLHVSGQTRQYLALLRLLSANLFFNHIMGTLYMAIVLVNPVNNWMISYGIANNTWPSKYNYSLYFAISVTTTAVLGDVRPANNRQTILTQLMMIYGVLVLAYNITQMTNIFALLQQTRYQTQKQLRVLQRMAKDSKIRNKLHREMADYIVHSTQSKFQVQIQERKKVLQKLPQNLKAQFLEQNSHIFFQKMPFFSILRSQSKKLLAQNFQLQISSPGQYLTHKREGMQKVIILKTGTMGMAYKKRNATLNGMVLEKMVVENDHQDNPILLNCFLSNRRKRQNYSLVCQTFCTVATIDFSDLNNNLRECEVDYQFWKQFYDSDQALDEDWTVKQCLECYQFHTMFNCPKLTYMPLRSMIYLKYTSGKSKNGLEQFEYQQNFQQAKTTYLRDLRKRKNKEAVKSPLKFWHNVFLPLEKILEIDTEKNYYYFNERSMLGNKKKNIKKEILRVIEDDYETHECDNPSDFEYYFKMSNPKNLVKINLSKKKRHLAQYIPSISIF